MIVRDFGVAQATVRGKRHFDLVEIGRFCYLGLRTTGEGGLRTTRLVDVDADQRRRPAALLSTADRRLMWR
jgi:hypothetical protein